ncbi:acyltransferase [Jatrophihabitans sp. YIM 134969]
MNRWAWVRWAVRHRAWTPWYLIRYLRLARLKLRHPQIHLQGLVFLDRDVDVKLERGRGRLVLGPWTHLGRGSSIRCHEGTLRIGAKCVVGQRSTINTYLDVEIGEAVIMADDVYISDFDHRTDDRDRPIKDQGIVKARVRIEDDVWLGVKSTVGRGVVVGRGTVVGANAVVTRDVPPYSVAVGAPARVVRKRGDRR